MTGCAAHSQEAERVRRFYQKSAGRYDKQMRFWDRILDFDNGRRWVCRQATGDVLEIGAGTGLNLPYYPDGARLTAIEFSPEMLELARARAREIGRDVDLKLGDAQALEFPDESFDTVVCTLALCTIPDDRRAVAEARRVLRPGGRLLLLEHVRSSVLPIRIGQRILQPLTLRFEADHLLRDPADYLSEQDFDVETLERSKWGIVERVVARKPGS